MPPAVKNYSGWTIGSIVYFADKIAMKGCRPLNEAEIKAVLEVLARNRHAARDTVLFLMGLKTGFRISELLSLRVEDVFHNGKILTEVCVARRFMKKKRESRTVPFLNEQAREALQQWLGKLGVEDPKKVLFPSREGSNNAIDRRTAWNMLTKAFDACELPGKLATHSMRKTFAKTMKDILGGDLQALQKAMGHAEITSTMSYLQVDEEKVHDAFRKI